MPALSVFLLDGIVEHCQQGSSRMDALGQTQLALCGDAYMVDKALADAR